MVLWNLPYVGVFAGLHRYAPSFVNPTFVILLCALIVIQTSLLGFSSLPLWTRALLLYVYLLGWMLLAASLATQVVCGKDLIRLGYSLLQSDGTNKRNESPEPAPASSV